MEKHCMKQQAKPRVEMENGCAAQFGAHSNCNQWCCYKSTEKLNVCKLLHK